MPFKSLNGRYRKDPLGYSRVNEVMDNQAENQAMFLREHLSTGEHNFLRDMRGVAYVLRSGGAYSLVGESASITGISTPATGRIVIDLDSAYSEQNAIVAIATPHATAAGGPVILNTKRVSATQFEIYQWRGSSWAAEDNSFSLGFYAPPVKGTPTLFSIDRVKRGMGLGPDTYNAIVENQQTLYSQYEVAHNTSTGAHSHQETPKAAAKIVYSAGYTKTTLLGTVSSVSAVGTGIVDVTLPGSTYLNNPNPSLQIFLRPAGAVGEHWVAMAQESSWTNTGNYLTTFRVHLWKRSAANTWALTDGSFWFVLCSTTG